MRKTFLMSVFVLLSVLLAIGTAGADVFYTTENGTLGTIVIESAESIDLRPTVVQNLGTNLDVSTFGVDGGTRVMVTKRSTGGDDTAVIYTPGNWTDSTDCILTKTHNIHSTANAGNGKSFYTASWGNASIVEYDNTSSYKATGRQYVYTPSSGTAHAEDVLVGSWVYGLFSVQSDDAEGKTTYLPSRIVWMDGQLSNTVQGFGGVNTSPNASGMAFLSDGRIAIAYRGNERKGGIDLLSGSTITSLISGDQYGEIPTLCSDGDKGLYFVGQKLSEDVNVHVDTLYRRKSDGTFSTVKDSITGSFVKVAWDDSHKLLVLATENKIAIFKDDKLLKDKEFSNDQLGGTVSSMALTAPAGKAASSSSSNCSALTTGSLALLLLPLALLRRRKR